MHISARFTALSPAARLAALIAVMLMVLTVAASAQESGDSTAPQSGSQFELLDLSSPAVAVQTFVERFQSADYAAVFLILAPDTQDTWRRYVVATFDYGYWVAGEQANTIVEGVFQAFNDGTIEQSLSNVPYLFHEVMRAAAENDALLIDLRGAVEITGEEMLNDESSVAVVTATVEGIDGEVNFYVQRLPSGRWRVVQVAVPGGDPDWIPWSVPGSGDE